MLPMSASVSVPSSTAIVRKQVFDTDKTKSAHSRTASSPFSSLSRHLQLRLQYARLKVEHGWQKQSLNEVENLYFHHHHHLLRDSSSIAGLQLPSIPIATVGETLAEQSPKSGFGSEFASGIPESTQSQNESWNEELRNHAQAQSLQPATQTEPAGPSVDVAVNVSNTPTEHTVPENLLTPHANEEQAPDSSTAASSVPSVQGYDATLHINSEVFGKTRSGGGLATASTSSSPISIVQPPLLSVPQPASPTAISAGAPGLQVSVSMALQTPSLSNAAMGQRTQSQSSLNLGPNTNGPTRPRMVVNSTSPHTRLNSPRLPQAAVATSSRSSAALTYDSFWSSHATSVSTYGYGPYIQRPTQDPPVSPSAIDPIFTNETPPKEGQDVVMGDLGGER